VEFVLVWVLAALYASLFLYLLVGVLRARRHQAHRAMPGVSVVIPLHNEEEWALRTLKAVALQDYQGEWEVLCVNDRSTDRTAQILEDFASQNVRFRVLHVPMDAPPLPSPKKRALETGFAQAKYDVLLLLDADCIPPVGWLASMAGRFTPEIGIVQGAKRNSGPQTPLYAYQKLDTLGFTLIECAGFSQHTPMLASAASLAYRKELFYKVGGFNDLMQYMSGDDDMLVHKMVKEPIDFCYNLDPDAMISTEPVPTWRGLLRQRARWASNGTRYSNPFYVIFLTLIYCFYLWLTVGPLFAWAGLVDWSLWWQPLLLKVVIDILFLGTGAYRLHMLPLLVWLPIVEAIQIPLIAVAVPMGTFLRNLRWK